MDLYKQRMMKVQAELDLFPQIAKCVICQVDLKQNGTNPILLCGNKICKNVWLLIPVEYRRWFHTYNKFRSERKHHLNWLDKFNIKIKEHLIMDREFQIYFYKNGTFRDWHNTYTKKPVQLKITEKYNEYKLKSKLVNELDKVDRRIKNNMIDLCKPIKFKINRYNYEKQHRISNPC